MWICQFFFYWDTIGRDRNFSAFSVQEFIRVGSKSGTWRDIGLVDLSDHGGYDFRLSQKKSYWINAVALFILLQDPLCKNIVEHSG